MGTDLIHDRGRGPELVGTRITVYNLLPHFLDATATEDEIRRIYDLTPEQVAAARAYILNHPDTVLAQHLKIEERIAVGNPPEVREKAERIHAVFMSFKEWLANQEKAEAQEHSDEGAKATARNLPDQFPTFREWFAAQRSQQTEES